MAPLLRSGRCNNFNNAEARTLRCLHAQALPLGILPEMDGAIPVALEMKPGDIVLLITDGFFEWQNPKEEPFGAERLAAVVGQFSDREPEIIIAELYDAVLKFSQGTPQIDDLTAVLIKRVAVGTCPITVRSALEQIALARAGAYEVCTGANTHPTYHALKPRCCVSVLFFSESL